MTFTALQALWMNISLPLYSYFFFAYSRKQLMFQKNILSLVAELSSFYSSSVELELAPYAQSLVSYTQHSSLYRPLKVKYAAMIPNGLFTG